jgi:hypothetical protein
LFHQVLLKTRISSVFIAENSLIIEPDSVAGDSEEIMDEDDVLAVSCLYSCHWKFRVFFNHACTDGCSSTLCPHKNKFSAHDILTS